MATVLLTLLTLHSLGRSPSWLDPALHLPHAYVCATEPWLERNMSPCWLASLKSMPRVSGSKGEVSVFLQATHSPTALDGWLPTAIPLASLSANSPYCLFH